MDFFGQLPEIFLLTPVFSAVIALLFLLLERTDRAEGPETGILARKKWLIPLILLICWLPAFLAEYPGGFRYDATGELAQSAGFFISPAPAAGTSSSAPSDLSGSTDLSSASSAPAPAACTSSSAPSDPSGPAEYVPPTGYRGDYPLLHSAIVAFLLPLMHSLTGSWNTGVTVYVLLQMLLMAALYTHILRTLIRKGVHRFVIRYALAYCALFPVIQILVVQELRDVMFAALVTHTVFCLWLLRTEKDRILTSPWKPAACAVVMSLMLQSRINNAGIPFLILVILVNLCIWLKNRKAYFRGATLWAVSGIGSFALLSLLLSLICQPLADGPSPRSSMSLLSQPLARAYVLEGDNWPEEDRETISEYMDLEGMRYTPAYADDTKSRIRVNAFRYAAFCAKIGLKYPAVYLDAVLAQTQKMWDPSAVADGYKQYFTSPGDPYYDWDKCYFSILPENDPPVEHRSLLPGLLDFYTTLGLRLSFEKIPVLSWFFSIGAQLWLTLFLFAFLWYRRKTSLLLPVGAILLYMIGNAFVPLVLLRYFAAVFFCHPMIAAFLFQPKNSSAPAGRSSAPQHPAS